MRFIIFATLIFTHGNKVILTRPIKADSFASALDEFSAYIARVYKGMPIERIEEMKIKKDEL